MGIDDIPRLVARRERSCNEFYFENYFFAIKADCYFSVIPNGRSLRKYSATEHMCRMETKRRRTPFGISLKAAQMMALNASFPIHVIYWEMHSSTTSCVAARRKLLSPSLDGKLSTARESFSPVGEDSRSTELVRAEWRVTERKGSFCVGGRM